VRDGEEIDAREIETELRRAGYSDGSSNGSGDGSSNKAGQSALGSFRLLNDGIEITPGPESYHSPEAARISIHDGQVDRISSNGHDLSAYELEPQLVTSLFDSEQRSKRQLVKYNEIPPVMVQAVLAIEDRSFFEHSGVNFVRFFGAVLADLTRRVGLSHQKFDQGGSTLTMQLSRGFFLNPEDKTVRRKLTEMLISEELERKFTSSRFSKSMPTGCRWGREGHSPSAGWRRRRRLISIRS
jgi:penicillin-binding protein 1B